MSFRGGCVHSKTQGEVANTFNKGGDWHVKVCDLDRSRWLSVKSVQSIQTPAGSLHKVWSRYTFYICAYFAQYSRVQRKRVHAGTRIPRVPVPECGSRGRDQALRHACAMHAGLGSGLWNAHGRTPNRHSHADTSHQQLALLSPAAVPIRLVRPRHSCHLSLTGHHMTCIYVQRRGCELGPCVCPLGGTAVACTWEDGRDGGM